MQKQTYFQSQTWTNRLSQVVSVGWNIGFGIALGGIVLGEVLPAHAVKFPDAGDRGAPARTTGGGTRGESCASRTFWSTQDTRALVPLNNVSTFSKEQAALWIHVSDYFKGNTAEIYVKEAATNTKVYEESFAIAALEQDGIMKIELPAESESGAALLETGKDYYWEVSIVCDVDNRTQDFVLQGLMHRVEADADLDSAIAAATPVEQVERYASEGLWQETLEGAIALKAAQPQLWADLLSSVQLESLIPGGPSVESASGRNGGFVPYSERDR